MQAFDLKGFVVSACLAATQETDWWGSWWDDPRSRCGRWWSDQLRGIREDDDGQVSHHITSAEAKASSPQLHSFNAPVLDFVVWALLSFRGRLYHGSPFEHPTEFKDAKDIRVRRSICSMHNLFHATSGSLDFSYWSPTISAMTEASRLCGGLSEHQEPISTVCERAVWQRQGAASHRFTLQCNIISFRILKSRSFQCSNFTDGSVADYGQRLFQQGLCIRPPHQHPGALSEFSLDSN